MFFLKELPDEATLARYAERYPTMQPRVIAEALSMLRSASVLLRELEGYFAGHGLSQTRFLVLIVIDREAQSLTLSEVGQRLDVSKPVISRTMAALVREGLVTTRVDEVDRRSQRLQLTDAGRSVLERLLPGYYALIQQHMHAHDSQPANKGDAER